MQLKVEEVKEMKPLSFDSIYRLIKLLHSIIIKWLWLHGGPAGGAVASQQEGYCIDPPIGLSLSVLS